MAGELWKVNPLVSQEAFNQYYENLDQRFKANFAANGLASQLNMEGGGAQLNSIESLVQWQNSMLTDSTLGMQSPQQHAEMLKTLERKCLKHSFAEAQGYASQLIQQVESFWQFFASLQIQRQLQPPMPLLRTNEPAKGLVCVAAKSLLTEMKENAAAGKTVFRNSTFGETLLEQNLDGIMNGLQLGIGEVAKRLMQITEVFQTNPDALWTMWGDSFSQAQIRANKMAQVIGKNLTKNSDPAQLNDKVRAFLALTIVTGDIQYLLEVVKACQEASDSQQLEVSDLLSLLVVLARKYYSSTAYPPALEGIIESKQQLVKHRFSNKESVFNFPPENVLWDGEHIYTTKEETLLMLDGRLDSKTFGKQIASNYLAYPPEGMYFSQDKETNERCITVTRKQQPKGSVEVKMFDCPDWDSVFESILNFANLYVLKNRFTLIDIGYSSSTEAEGKTPKGWVIFARTVTQESRRIKLIKKITEEGKNCDWDWHIEWLNKTVKSVANRFFKIAHSPVNCDTRETGWWMSVWFWSTPQTALTEEMVEVKKAYNGGYFESTCEYAWNEFIKPLKDQRILDAKASNDACYADVYYTVVLAKQEGFSLKWDQELESPYATFQAGADEMQKKLKKQDLNTLICCFFQPRASNSADQKCLVFCHYKDPEASDKEENEEEKPEEDQDERKFESMAVEKIERDTLEECFEPLMKFVNEEVLAKGHTPLDLGFTVKGSDEEFKAVAYVVYDEKGHLPPPPSKKLGVIRKEITHEECPDWKAVNAWLSEQVKQARNRFFRLGFDQVKRTEDSAKMAALWVWEDLELDESEVSLQVIPLPSPYTHDDDTMINALESHFRDKEFVDKRIVDVKIGCSKLAEDENDAANGIAFQALVVIIEDPGALVKNFGFSVGKDDMEWDSLMNKLLDLLVNKETKIKDFLGIGLQIQRKDLKLVLGAWGKYSKTSIEKLNFSASNLAQKSEELLKWPLKKGTILSLGNQVANLLKDETPIVLELDARTSVKLSSPEILKGSCLLNAAEYEGGLALHYDSHLACYSLASLKEAAQAGKECEPVVKAINTEVAERLYLRSDRSDFFFMCKNPEGSIGMYSPDAREKDIALTLHLFQPNKELVDFTKELEFFLQPIHELISQKKEESCVSMCLASFEDGKDEEELTNFVANKITSSRKISPSNLSKLLIDLLGRFNSMLEEQALDSKKFPMMLLSTPFTISQKPDVLAKLFEFAGSASSLDSANQLQAFYVLLNHLLALRQNGRSLAEVMAQVQDFAIDLLESLCKLEERVNEFNDLEIQAHYRGILAHCFTKFSSLMHENAILVQDKPQRQFPDVHPSCKTSDKDEYKLKTFTLPNSYILEATESIRIKALRMSYDNTEDRITAVRCVFWNGVKEFQQAETFGYDNLDAPMTIQSDREWTRSFMITGDPKRPFFLSGIKFGDVEVKGEGKKKGKLVQMKEHLVEGEFILGYTAWVDQNPDRICSLNFKIARMPQFQTTHVMLPMTVSQLRQANIPELTRDKLMTQLINRSCPYSENNLEVGLSQEEIKQSIVAYFSAKVGSSEFSTGFNFLSYFASVAMKREDPAQINQVRGLFDTAWEALMKPGNNEPDSLCALTIAATASMMIVNDREELANRALQCMCDLSSDHADKSNKESIMKHQIIKLFIFIVQKVARDKLTLVQEKKGDAKEEEEGLKTNENAMVIDLLNQSDLFSGGLERKQMHQCTEETRAKLQQLGQTINLKLMVKSDKAEAQDEQVETLKAIINPGKNEFVDHVVKALQNIILKNPRLRVTAQSQGQVGFRLTRCAFAVMLKFSGKVQAFSNLVDSVEFESDPLTRGDGDSQPLDQDIVKIVQQSKDSAKLVTLWTSATKMRAWLQQEKAQIAAEIDAKFPMKELHLTDEEKDGKSEAEIATLEQRKTDEEQHRVQDLREKEEASTVNSIIDSIESKAHFLILLEIPKHFNSLDEDSAEFKREKTIEEEIQKSEDKPVKMFSQGIFSSLKTKLHGKFEELKKLHAETVNIKNKQEKLTQLREAGVASVLACLQAKIQVSHIQEKVEKQLIAAAERLVGLRLVIMLMKFATSLGEAGESYLFQAVSILCQSLQSNSDKMAHYLDGLLGCGNFFEDQLRETFFGIIGMVLRHIERQSEIKPEYIQSLQWNYKARDFKSLLKLGLLKYFMWGRTREGLSGCFGANQALSQEDLDPVVRAHTFDPTGPTSKTLFYTFNDLFLSILIRFGEENEERGKLQIPLNEKKISMSIQRSMSVVDSSELEQLLGQTFDVVFHEFELFLDISAEFQHCERINGKSFEEVHAFMVERLIRKKATGKADSDEPIEGEQTESVQAIANRYRESFEKIRLDSMLSLVDVFICIASTYGKSLQLLQNVTNPSHINTLSRFFVQASPKMKVIVLHIFQNLITIKMPDEAFTTGLQEVNGPKTEVTFTNRLAQVLFSFAVQIRSGKWQSAYETESGLSDVLVHLTRTISLSLRQTGKTEELQNFLERIEELPEVESDVLFHILGAHHQQFVYQDRLLNVSENKLVIHKLNDRKPSSSLVCPEVSQQTILLSKPVIYSLIKTLCSDKAKIILKGKVLKLLSLQHLHNQDFASLLDTSLRKDLIAYLQKQGSQTNGASKHSLRNLEFMLSFKQSQHYDSFKALSEAQSDEEVKVEAESVAQEEGPSALAESPASSAKSCTVRRFMEQTGTKLHEVVLALSDDKEATKTEYVSLLTPVLKTIEDKEGRFKLFECQNALGHFLNEKLQALISGLSESDLEAKLKSIDSGEVSKLLGDDVAHSQAEISRRIFSSGLNQVKYYDGIRNVLDTNFQVQDSKEAKKLFEKKKQGVPLSYQVKLPEGFAGWELDEKLRHLKKSKLHLRIDLNQDSIEIPTHKGHSLTCNQGREDAPTEFKCMRIRLSNVCMSADKNKELNNKQLAYFCRVCEKQSWCDGCMKASIFLDALESEGDELSTTDVASAFLSKLAAKLLFAISDCSDISDSERDLSLLSALLSYYGEASAELSNQIPGAIWECTFKPRVLSQLALPKDQREESFYVYEGSESNIHKVLASVQLPSVDDLKTKMLSILTGLHKSNPEIVNRLIHSQVIDKFVRQCVNSHEFRGSNSLEYDNLGSLLSQEDQRKLNAEVQQQTVEEQAQGFWFVYNEEKKHTKTFILREGGVCRYRSDPSWDERKKGTWKVVVEQEEHETIEIQVEEEKFEFRWNVNRKAELKDHEGHEVRQMMDFSQLAGTWTYHTDHDLSSEAKVTLTADHRAVNQEGYCYDANLRDNGTIQMYYSSWSARELKIISNTVLQETDWDDQTHFMRRLTQMPKKEKQRFTEKDLVGKWWYCEEGVRTEEQNDIAFADEFREDGKFISIKDGIEDGKWHIQDDGNVQNERDSYNERIWRWVDANTLELIKPKQTPTSLLIRAEPVKKSQELNPKELKISSSQLQVNSLVVNLIQQDPGSWSSLLPQMFEMTLFSLCLASSPLKIRTVIEQSQVLLHAAHESKSVSQLALKALVKSDQSQKLATITKEYHLESQPRSLVEVLIADICVQQHDLNKRLEEPEAMEVLAKYTITQLQDLRNQFFKDEKTCTGIKQAFVQQNEDELGTRNVLKTIKVTQADEAAIEVDYSQFSENVSEQKLVCKMNSKKAQGNADHVLKITYQEDGSSVTKLVNLDSELTFPVEANFTIEPVPLPEVYIAQTNVPEDEDDRKKKLTDRFQFENSLTTKFDEVITDLNTDMSWMLMWGNGYKSLMLFDNDENDLQVFPNEILPQQLLDKLAEERQEGWRRPDIKVSVSKNQQCLILLDGHLFVKKDDQSIEVEIEGGHKVLDMVSTVKTIVLITEGGLFERGLTNLVDGEAEDDDKPAVKKVTKEVFPDLVPEMEFKRMWIQNNNQDRQDMMDNTGEGYLFVEVAVNGVKSLYSFGKNESGCLGDGRDPKAPEKIFHKVVYDNSAVEFVNLYLSPNMALAVAQDNSVWMLGGKPQIKDETMFPFGFDEPINFPIQTGIIVEHPITKIVNRQENIWILFKTGDFTHCRWINYTDGKLSDCLLNYYSKESGLDRESEIDNDETWHHDLMVTDLVSLSYGTFIFVKKCPTFEKDFSVEFTVEIDAAEASDKKLEEVLNGNKKWEAFQSDFEKAFKSQQFVTDCLESLNAHFASNEPEFTETWLTDFDTKQVELKGDSFSTDRDKELAVFVMKKLMIINGLQAKIKESKLDQIIESDPFSILAPGLGMPSTVRNWGAGLRSSKRYLIDKFFEKNFDEILKTLPSNTNSKITVPFNRFKARRFEDSGKVDTGDGDTVFMQLMRKLKSENPDFTIWRKGASDPVFGADFQHEGSIDAGGPYRATHDWMCKEVQSSVLPMLIPTENQRNLVGEMRDAFVLNYASISEKELEQFFFMGLWIGNAIRSGEPLTLTIHPTVWKRLVGVEDFSLYDLKTTDLHKYNELSYLRTAAGQVSSNEEFQMVVEQNFTVTYGAGKQMRTVELCPDGFSKMVSLDNLEEYISLAVTALLLRDEVQMEEFKRGVYHTLSRNALHSCSWRYAEGRACGKHEIDIDLLRQHTNWNVSSDRKMADGTSLEDAFWKMLKEFSEENKQLYLKFVNGRGKLPLDIANEPRTHTVNDMGGNNATLPQSHTCFNTLDLPPYTDYDVMCKRMITAISFCGEIDTDGGRRTEY